MPGDRRGFDRRGMLAGTDKMVGVSPQIRARLLPSHVIIPVTRRSILWIRIAHPPSAPTARRCQAIVRLSRGSPPVSNDLVLGLKCRLCGKLYPKEALNFCTDDFGPLEVDYDYDADRARTSAAARSSRARTTCGAIASCCPSTASRPSARTSAARRWSRPIAWPKRSASTSFGSRTTPSTSRRSRSRIASSPSRCQQGRRVRLQDRRLCLDRQPGQQRRRQRRRGRAGSLHPRPRRSGAGQDSRHARSTARR